MERREQKRGLGGAQPEKKLEIRQIQPDDVIDDVIIFRQVRIDEAPDFHEVPLEKGGEAGKSSRPPEASKASRSGRSNHSTVQVVMSWIRRKTSEVVIRKSMREARSSRFWTWVLAMGRRFSLG